MALSLCVCSAINDAGVRWEGEWDLGWTVLRGSYSAPQRDREMATEFHSSQFHMHLEVDLHL